MKTKFGLPVFFRWTICLSIVLSAASPIWAQKRHQERSGVIDTTLIRQALGSAGMWNAGEGVYKVSFPRNDIKVKVDGISMPPFMGITTWVGFQQSGDSTMAMGDIVLFQDEVNPVMSVLLDGGMSVTALHNHFFYSDPPVYFMHIGGEGKLEDQAKTVRAALDKIKAIRKEHPTLANGFGISTGISASSLSASPIDQILKIKGISQDGMLKYVVGRNVTMPCGCVIGKEMGAYSWAGFMGSTEHAVIDGDFATAEGELQPVLKALRHADINIVAIHSHMEGDNPHLIFLHYWGTGPADRLAQGFRSALDAQSAEVLTAR